LDPALIRSGRLDRHIRVELPDRDALALILREHLGSELAGEDLSSASLAALGATGADCERLVRGARRRARSAGRDMILADLLDEVSGNDRRSEADLWTAAIHEAGHVVAITMLRPGATEMVTLNGRDDIGGSTSARIIKSVHQRPDDVRDQLIIRLAGRAVEHELFGVPSSGAGGAADSDLATATKIAMISDAAYGFSDQGGMVWRGMPDSNLVARTLAADKRMEARIRRQLDKAYRTARRLVGSQLRAVEGLARVLVLRRILDGREAEEIVRQLLQSTDDRR
jgi:ATP-dependent Zn protease